MSSSKRRRTIDDDGELDVEHASSSLRQNIHKRPRAVLAAENGGSTVSDDDDDMNDGDTGRQKDEDDIDQDQEEYYRRQLSKHRENVEQENGIIEEIHCTNFMCHAKFSITLGPLINFVIGHNGSGKSAVMTALTICLGNKASSTNRGGNLKSMIKEGTEAATVKVKIKNRGADAYRPEQYGRSVIVERHFSRSGGSSFKLKNSEGKVISTKKRDLDDIIDYWGLQLDNPINVLNQDMARQFLSNSTPHDKYKFFIKGTQLESLDADYNIMEEEIIKLQSRLYNSKDDLKKQKANLDQAKARKQRLEASDSFRTEINRISRMHAWAQVEEQEQIADQRRDDVAKAEQQVIEAEHTAETSAGRYEAAQQALERSAQNVAALEEGLEPTKVKQRAELEQFESGKAKLQELQNSSRAAKEDYNAERKKKAKLSDAINAERALLADANGQEHTARLQRMDQLKIDQAQAQEDVKAHQQAQPKLDQARLTAVDEVEKAREPIAESQAKVDRAEATLETMQRNQDRRFTGYKRNMENLVNQIARETRWREKPVGPMGLHLTLLKPEWMGLIEKMFGQTLEQFVVTSREDQVLLAEVMRRAKCEGSILIGNARSLDTTGKEPSDDLLTVMRALKIDNELVRNQLIISHNIEQIVLIRDRDSGQHFMNQRNPNVKAVVTFRTSNTRGEGVRFDLSRSGAQRSSPLQIWSGPSRMQTNIQDQINNQRGQIDSARRELEDYRRLLRDKQNAQRSAEQALTRWKRDRDAKVLGAQRAGDDIEALQEEIERNRPEDGRLQELERQLKTAEDNEVAKKNITADLVREKATIDESQRDIKSRLNELDAEINSHNQRLDAAYVEQNDLTEKRQAALKQKNEDIANISSHKSALEDCVESRDAQIKLVDEEFIPKATAVCPRIALDKGMTVAKLDSRMDLLRRDIARAEQEAGGRKEDIIREYAEAAEAYSKTTHTFESLQQLSAKLRFALNTRQERWVQFRRHITARARTSFSYLLSERRFTGSIILDHQDKQLDIKVEPNAALQNAEGRATLTLSGGEKSFSTVCLLLSIWEAMGSPIRCLDEFDVFMDSVNRNLSLNLIIQAARRSVGRQYIFITPQSMQSVSYGSDVTIHKIADPERGQTALPFTQA